MTADFSLAGVSPIFNNKPQDLDTLTLKNRTRGDAVWMQSITANHGDRIAFNVYYRNTVFGTIAHNTRIRITFPTSKLSRITPVAHISADNTPTENNNAVINVSMPERLTFDSSALWYPDQSTVGQSVPVEITSNSAEVNIGDIKSCWAHQGYLVFEAVLSETPINPNLSISKLTRNISTGGTNWRDSITASPSDKISFKINVRSTGDATAENVYLRNILPTKMTYLGNLRIDGSQSSQNIITGINLGTLAPNQRRIITFDAQVYPKENFSYGNINLINRARVHADNVSFREDPATVKVQKTVPNNPEFSVEKLSQNISKEDTGWYNSVYAVPFDRIAFQIRVSNTGNTRIRNIIVKSALPEQINYIGNIKVNGSQRAGNLISGININDIAIGEDKIITFEARVRSGTNFSFGQTKLTNNALAYNTEGTKTDATTIIVTKKAVAGAATEIITGFRNRIIDSLLLPLILTIILVFLFKNYFFKLEKYVEKKREERRIYLDTKTLNRYIKKEQSIT